MTVVGSLKVAIEDAVHKASSHARPRHEVALPAHGLSVHVVNDKGLFLEVTNLREPDLFSARLQLLDGLDKVHDLGSAIDFRSYAGAWQKSGTSWSELATGGSDRLLIGRVQGGSRELPRGHSFKMTYYDQASACRREYGTTGWIDGVAGIIPPRLELRVSIRSLTRPGKRLYENTFALNADDPQVLRDEKMLTTEFTGVRIWHY